MLGDLAARVDPRDRGQRPGFRRGEELRQRLNVPQLAIVLDRVEVRQRIPDPGRARVLPDSAARHRRILLAVRLGPVEHVVAPAHPRLVQEVREVGPRVVGRRIGPGGVPEVRRVDRTLYSVDTAHRIAATLARTLGAASS